MDRIFVSALSVDSLEHLPVLHAELLNVYGYFSINKANNFEKGLVLFKRAIDIHPREPQRWINLVKLQIAMGRFDEAEQTLEKFRVSDTHGSVVKEIVELQSEIDNMRAATTAGNGLHTSTHTDQ